MPRARGTSVDLKEEAILGNQVDRHWYYRAKLAALMRATNDLPASAVLDVGAGSGYFSRSLLQASRATGASCVDPGYPADGDEMVGARPLRFRRAMDDEASNSMLVLMMDVLEHVRFIVTVPAFMWMWSGHDVFLEHYRRYTLTMLETALRAAGLRIEFGSYYYGVVLPLAAALRIGKRLLGDSGTEPRSDMRQLGPMLNGLLWAACRMELPFLRHNRLGGLSVLVRAMKP